MLNTQPWMARLLIGASLAALSAPAAAQDQAPSTAEQQAGGEAEIVVTARKRVERLQDVPMTIDVLGGDQLRSSGIASADQIEASVPGLAFGNAGFDGALVGLRGVSSQRGFTGDEAAVAVHIDGVFQPQSAQALARLFDIERIEVLKGPQGTLYGRNANAGVINIISVAPTDRFEGYAQASYGSYDRVRGEGAVNIPIAPGHAIRLSASAARGDGYIKNVLDDRSFGDDRFVAGRARYRGEISDNVELNLTAQLVNDDSKNDGALVPAPRGSAAVATDRATGFYDTIVNTPFDQNRRDFNWSGQLDIDLGGAAVRAITGGSSFKNRSAYDVSLADTAAPEGLFQGRQRGHSISQELQLFSQGSGALSWRIGGYYISSKVRERRFYDNFGSPFVNNDFYDDFSLRQSGNAYAIFGETEWKIVDTVKLTLGLRYNDERKTQTQDEVFGFAAPAGVAPLCSAATPGAFETCRGLATAKASWNGFSGRAGIDWQITPTSLVYASYGRGFRSGAIGGLAGVDNFFDAAFFGTGQLGLTPLDEEKVDAYEIGTKNSFMDGRLTVNLSGFYTKFTDQLAFATDPNQNFRVIEGNLGSSTIKGLDILLAAKLSDNLTLSVNSEILDAKIDKLGAIVNPGIVKGNRLPRAPKFGSVAAADVTIPLGSGRVLLRGEYAYKSKHYFNLQNTLVQNETNLLNVSARYEADSGWYVFASGRNITGDHYLVSGGVPTDAAPSFLGIARPGEPRMFEIGAGWRF